MSIVLWLPQGKEDMHSHTYTLTGGVRGVAGFAGPHRIDRAADRGLEESRRRAYEVGAGGGRGGILAVVAFDALGHALPAFHHGRLKRG